MGLAGLTSHDHGTGYQLSTNALTGKLLQGPGNTREQRGMHGSISSFGDDSAHKKRAQRAQQHTHPSARASHLPSPTPPPCSTTVALRQLGAYTCLPRRVWPRSLSGMARPAVRAGPWAQLARASEGVVTAPPHPQRMCRPRVEPARCAARGALDARRTPHRRRQRHPLPMAGTGPCCVIAGAFAGSGRRLRHHRSGYWRS